MHLFSRLKGKWSSEGMASFGSSFWLVVIAAVVYLMNITIIAVATRDPHRQRKVKWMICSQKKCVNLQEQLEITIIKTNYNDYFNSLIVFQAKQLNPLPGKQAGDTMLY